MSNLQQDNYPQGQPGYNTGVVSFKDWMITILLMAIPIVNIVMLFVWGFSGSTNPSKANYAKATLVWIGIFIVLYVLLIVIFGAAFMSAINSSTGSGY
ncbi:hypothetical protein [Paenibacillus sp. Z6-24]